VYEFVARGTTEELFHSIENRIITLRMVAVDEEEFIYEHALTVVFKENYEAKRELKRLEKRISRSIEETQERFYQLDDERSFQSRSAWMRTRRLHRRQMVTSRKNVPKRASKIDIPSNIKQVSTRLTTSLRGLPPDEVLPIVKSISSEALEEIKTMPGAVLIGPEGGFSGDERKLLLGCSFVVPISLGSRILRADTAAVAALALINAVRDN